MNYILFPLALCALLCASAAVAQPDPKGLNGQVSNVRILMPASDEAPPVAGIQRQPDIDLKTMAEWSLRFLTNTPRKHLNYEPVFQIYPYRCPPAPEGSDPVVGCDTDARMDPEWYHLRDITGSTRGKDVEQGYHKRMLDFVDDDGIVWCHPGAFNEGDTTAVYDKKDFQIHNWGACKILTALCEDYQRHKNPESKAKARKMMLALKSLLRWDDQGRCWSASGNGTLDANRNPVSNGWNAHPLPVIEPLIRYYQVFKDPEALAFAKAYAEGMIAGVQPDGIKFGEDGSFQGHSHVTMHSVWNVAHLGVVTGDRKYTEWAKRVFDFFLRERGTGVGWFVAAVGYPGDETCCVADVMTCAAYIARGGHPEYFDYMERYMRNRISPSYLIITPEMRAHYAELNKALGEEKVKWGLSEMEKYEGGVLCGVGLNDWENALLDGACYGGGPEIAMIGCCQGSGMRSVYDTWDNVIGKYPKSALGPAGIYVNMSFDRTSQWGDVFSFVPDQGRLTVKANVKDSFFLRVPDWAPREQVRAFIDSKPVPVKWSGAYVRFSGEPGQELTITYPVVAFQQQVGPGSSLPAFPDVKLTYQWAGNMVVDVTPKAKKTAIFTGRPRVLPPVKP